MDKTVKLIEILLIFSLRESLIESFSLQKSTFKMSSLKVVKKRYFSPESKIWPMDMLTDV